MDRLVLKKGNALSLVHKLGLRSSVDVDFSIADDFEDLPDTERQIFKALEDRFYSDAYVPPHPLERLLFRSDGLSATHSELFCIFSEELRLVGK